MISVSLVSIVDDDESVRESLEGLFKSVGFRVEAFALPGDFLNSSALHATDCLILDVRMPGMSGPELQRKLIASQHSVPNHFHHGVETFASAQRFVARAKMEPPVCLILDVNFGRAFVGTKAEPGGIELHSNRKNHELDSIIIH